MLYGVILIKVSIQSHDYRDILSKLLLMSVLVFMVVRDSPNKFVLLFVVMILADNPFIKFLHCLFSYSYDSHAFSTWTLSQYMHFRLYE
jgi:hypothetical protein